MTQLVDSQPVTTGLLEALRTGTGWPFGDHGPPESTAEHPDPTKDRYGVVHKIDGGEVSGTYGEPCDETTLVYQINCHGRSREQCEWLLHRVAKVLLDRDASGLYVFPIPGVFWRFPQTISGVSAEGTDETQRPLFSARPRYELTAAA